MSNPPVFPAIPDPRENLPNHRDVLQAIKQNVETLTGQNGGANNAAWLRGEALAYVRSRLTADMHFYHAPIPTANEQLFSRVVLRKCYFPIGFVGSRFACVEVPTDPFRLSIVKNVGANGAIVGVVLYNAGEQFGTLVEESGATYTNILSFEEGETVTVFAQSTPDGAITGITVGLCGYLT